mmetsp:Transcript_107219/g.345962  ORF Transcript_107219/g.345962 Transcript_107219/m.345962 type:complete len:247 (+) Transcript_107219:840-1580(+)
MRFNHRRELPVDRLHRECGHDQLFADTAGARPCMARGRIHRFPGRVRHRDGLPPVCLPAELLRGQRLEVERLRQRARALRHLRDRHLARGPGFPAHHARPAHGPRAAHPPRHARLPGPAAHGLLHHAEPVVAVVGAAAAAHHHVPVRCDLHARRDPAPARWRGGGVCLHPTGGPDLVQLYLHDHVHLARRDHGRRELGRRRPASGGDLRGLPSSLRRLHRLRGHRCPQRADRYLCRASKRAQRPRP